MSLLVPPTVSIPEGSLTMGMPACPRESNLARPWPSGRVVSIPSFQLGRHPITNAEFRAYTQATGAPPPNTFSMPGFNADDQPVGGVSWLDAAYYCAWLSSETGQDYDLPTDAEWEYAARGGMTGLPFPWGTELSLNQAWYGGQAAPKPVGSFPPNGFGLHDMVGNIWEWCADIYSIASGGMAATNAPTGKDPRINRVLRGGSYLTKDPLNLWIAYRHEDPPDLRHECIGFRIALRSQP